MQRSEQSASPSVGRCRGSCRRSTPVVRVRLPRGKLTMILVDSCHAAAQFGGRRVGIGAVACRPMKQAIRLQAVPSSASSMHSTQDFDAAQRPMGPMAWDAWYAPSAPPLQRTMGPIKVQAIEGKGRGVVCTQDLANGDLVMVSEPLALLRLPEGQRPDTEALVDLVLEQGKHKHRWFQDYLYDGNPRSVRLVPDLSVLPEQQRSGGSTSVSGGGTAAQSALRRLAAKGKASSAAAGSFGANVRAAMAGKKRAATEGAEAGGNGSAASVGAEREVGTAGEEGMVSASGQDVPLPGGEFPGGVDRATALRTARTVRYNCFGDVYEDKAATCCRGGTLSSHIGVWPEMSMLNHSCSPNAVNYVLGDTMVVRAACHIKAGSEVTISYLGRPQLTPVELRVEYLQENYGFNCDCERCTAELIHIDKLAGQYEELYDEVTEELGPLFEIGKTQRDAEAVLAVRDRLRQATAGLYATFRRTQLSPQVRLFFSASLYDVFELQLACEAVALELEEEQRTRQQQQQQQDATSCGSSSSEGVPSVTEVPSVGPSSEALAAANSVIEQGLAQCVKAMAEVSPGSDLHALLAARYLRSIAEAHGPNSAKAAAARMMAVDACRARYGSTSQQLTDKLIELNGTLYE